MPQFPSKDERLNQKEAELEKELAAVRAEKKRRQVKVTPDLALDRMFHDPETSAVVANGVIKACGGNFPQAASILGTSVSDLHVIRRGGQLGGPATTSTNTVGADGSHAADSLASEGQNEERLKER